MAVAKSRDELSSWRARSLHSGAFTLFFAGANSAASLASKPIGFAVADEINKWPADVDNQGPPLALLYERMSNFARRKLLIASTPTMKDDGAIEEQYLLTDQRQYHVPCPHCGGVDAWHGLKWLKTPTPGGVKLWQIGTDTAKHLLQPLLHRLICSQTSCPPPCRI